MVFGDKPVIIAKKASFSEVVDKACDRLVERQAEYSIRRIQQMQEKLGVLEQELEEFLALQNIN